MYQALVEFVFQHKMPEQVLVFQLNDTGGVFHTHVANLVPYAVRQRL